MLSFRKVTQNATKKYAKETVGQLTIACCFVTFFVVVFFFFFFVFFFCSFLIHTLR